MLWYFFVDTFVNQVPVQLKVGYSLSFPSQRLPERMPEKRIEERFLSCPHKRGIVIFARPNRPAALCSTVVCFYTVGTIDMVSALHCLGNCLFYGHTLAPFPSSCGVRQDFSF